MKRKDVLFGLFVAVALFLAWQLADVLFLIFLSVILAAGLSGLSTLLARHTYLPYRLSLIFILILLILLISGAIYFAYPHLAPQVKNLQETLPQAISSLESMVADIFDIQISFSSIFQQYLQGGLRRVADIATYTANAVAALGFVVIMSIFIAMSPKRYCTGMVEMIPKSYRKDVRQIVDGLGKQLQFWLMARMVSMIAVGILTGVGLWILDVPQVLILAVIAGVLSLIPYLGPILGSIPAILVALNQSTLTVVWIILLYVVVQIIEGNLITPIVEKVAVSLPPALILSMQAIMSLLFGILGLVIASPFLLCLRAIIERYQKRT